MSGAVRGVEGGGGEDFADGSGVDVEAERFVVEGAQEGGFGGDDGYVVGGREGGVVDAGELGADVGDEGGVGEELEEGAVGVWDGVAVHSGGWC
jgi:hypothetical protein